MSRPILLLNCGSSSVKYQVIEADTEQVTAKGLIQKVGDVAGGTLDHTVSASDRSEQTFHHDQVFADHAAALDALEAAFGDHGPDLGHMIAVGHRTVHGGEPFRETTIINDAVVDKLKELYDLAPLHNPPAVAGIEAARRMLPGVPHVAVFDTAFFADLPAEAEAYAIDQALAKSLRIRKYGFHGTSHQYVSGVAPGVVGREGADVKQIICHLGNGASMSAVDGGRPIETSMGLTPLQGLVMGTRSGDIDPGIAAYLNRQRGWDADRIDTELNKNSGMYGLTGKTDMRDVVALVDAGDERAMLGLDVYIHRLVFYIGAYTALLGGLDLLVFTAGVGENSAPVRERVVKRLEPFGVLLDDAANQLRSSQPRLISQPHSRVAVLVVPTNEELAMARETLAAIRR